MSFGRSSSSNDEVIEFQKEQAAKAEARAAELDRRRAEAQARINAIFDGGTARWMTAPATTREVKVPGSTSRTNSGLKGADFFRALSGAAPSDEPRPGRVSLGWGHRGGITGGLAELFGNDSSAPRTRVETVPAQYATATYGGIGDDFYSGYRDAITSYYLPQLEDQYEDARQKTLFARARQGLGGSSVYAEDLGDLAQDYAEQRGSVINDADQRTAALRQNIARQKQAALELASTSENPSDAVNRALTEVNAAQTSTPELSPLSDVFDTAALAYRSFNQTRNQRRLLRDAGLTPPNASGSGREYV